MSQIVQVGVSHASAPLRWRERLAIGSHAVGPVAARLGRSAAAREALVLSTCSRVEAYAVGPDAGRLELELLGRLVRLGGAQVAHSLPGGAGRWPGQMTSFGASCATDSRESDSALRPRLRRSAHAHPLSLGRIGQHDRATAHGPQAVVVVDG